MHRYASHCSFIGKLARIALGLLLVVAVSGCVTTRSPELPPEQLREKIADGDMLQAGNEVVITTTDGQRQELQVTEVTDVHVVGSITVVSEGSTIDVDTLEPVQVVEQEEIRIPIDQIVTVEIRELTPAGKAAGAAGAVAAVGAFWYLIWILPALIVGAAL